MMPTKELAEVLASAPTATSLSGLSMLLKDSSNQLAAAGLTNATLKSVLTDAMVVRGAFSNIDECRTPGLYEGGGASSSGTYPNFGDNWKYGGLEVIPARGGRLIQRLTSESGDCAQRCWYLSSPSYWTAWKKLTP